MTDHIPERRRGLLPWFIVAWVVVPVAASVVWWWVAPQGTTGYVRLSDGKSAVKFLTAGVGEVAYTSDDPLRAFLRPRLPQSVVGILGDVLEGQTFGGSARARDLAVMYHVRRLQPGSADRLAGVIGTVELQESTGFTFVHRGDGFHVFSADSFKLPVAVNGLHVKGIEAFPRRDPTLTFRLFESGSGAAGNGVGPLVMEKTILNPGYRASFPTWVPEPVPTTKASGDLRVTLTSLRVDAQEYRVIPVLSVAGDDSGWREPNVTWTWADATGNAGEWLSPFEPAWKLHVSVRKRRDAEFSAHETWIVRDIAVPVGKSVTLVAQAGVVDGVSIDVRSADPANGTGVLGDPRPASPPVDLERAAMMSSFVGTPPMVKPFIRVDVDVAAWPAKANLDFIVRDEHGARLNNGEYDTEGHQFLVPFDPGPDTKTVSLEVRVIRPREVEFLVAPSQEMRDAVTRAAAAGRR
jgi:hypothetical protein